MARYYHMTIQPTLFGEWSLVREWGRIGNGGQVKQASFSSAEEARQAFTRLAKAKQRRGYC
jgi:predicted DNA-binding WGR domain protein